MGRVPRLAAVLALLSSTALAADKPEVNVLEGLPAGLAVDGDLKEWTSAPSVTLGPANQVAGPVKLAEPGDLSATVWVAISKDGLAVAGKVTDDKVRFASADKINADHAEIWLSLPAAALPPLAFANQFGEIEVPDADACGTLEEIEDPDACKKWVKEQRARRQSLERLFVRQYLLTQGGISEAWATPSKDGVPPEKPQDGCCSASKAVVKEVPGGWVFEARIDVSDFPATKQVPLKDLALLVDLVDADDGVDKLESFVSSSPRRKLGRTTTFNTFTLKSGILWETDPPLLDHFTAGHSIFYFPAAKVAAAYHFENLPEGYQYQPSQPSPSVHEMKYSDPPVAKLGDLSIYWHPSPHGKALHAFRGSTFIDGTSSEGELAANVKRSGTETHQFLIKHTGTLSALGTGTCGSCPVHHIKVVSVDKSGAFKTLLDEEVAESVPMEDGSMLEDVKVDHEKEFIRIGFSGKKLKEDGEDGGSWKKYWKWDAGKKTYVPEK